MPILTRRAFVTASSVAFAAQATRSRPAAAMFGPQDSGPLTASYPTEDPDLVRTIVGKSHVDYDTVRKLVTTRPELAKATWDWGFGDWESALGAASHMGRRDIAELLIDHGARPNLFTWAMLGQIDVVRAVCESNPGIQSQLGPHGITLLQHARHGREQAAGVVAYLEQLGDADIGQPGVALDETLGRTYVGDYAPDGVSDTKFVVNWNERRGDLTLARDDRQFRFLVHHGDHTFSPGGAPSVRVVFDGDVLTIRDGDLQVIAHRH